jgi:beta-lactamase class A
MVNRLLLLVLLVSALFSSSPLARAQASLRSALHAKLDSQLAHASQKLNGVIGYAIKDLSTGEAFFLQPDTVFPQASSIKLTILLELMRQAQEGKLSLSEKHTILHGDKTVGDDEPIITMLGDGTVTMTLLDLAKFMVVLSDNSATNILIDRLGIDNINSGIERLGMKETRLQRRMIDIEAARRGKENISTPREMMTLIEKIHAGLALDESHTRQYFDLLKLPKESEFHKALPATVSIADKPGSLDAVRCDTGVVEIPGHPFILSVTTTYLANNDEGEAVIEEIARDAYGYFDRRGRSSRYGRVISEK